MHLFKSLYVSIFMLCASVLCAPPSMAKICFLPGSDDIPLMPELKKSDPDAQNIFSAPEGRILSVVMSGHTAWSYVMNFYNASLRNLGWQKISTYSHRQLIRFKRNNEKLTITLMKSRNNIVFVRFDLVQN